MIRPPCLLKRYIQVPRAGGGAHKSLHSMFAVYICLILNRFRDRKTIRQRRINSLKKKISLKEKLLEVRSSKGSCKKFPFTANYRFICRYLCFETIQVWKIAFLLIGKSKEALNLELLIELFSYSGKVCWKFI